MSWLVTFFNTDFTYIVAIVLLMAGGVAWFNIPLLGKYITLVCVSAAVGLVAEGHGYGRAAAACHEAELRAQIEILNRDIAIAKSAAADAADRAEELDRSNADANQKVHDYENALAKRKNDSCGLSDDDYRRLRDIYAPH